MAFVRRGQPNWSLSSRTQREQRRLRAQRLIRTQQRRQQTNRKFQLSRIPIRKPILNVRRIVSNRVGFIRRLKMRQKMARLPPQQKSKEPVVVPNVIPKSQTKLLPKYDRFDLFNKQLRIAMINKYIRSNPKTEEIPFPSHISRIFAISIRPNRFDNLLARMGQWDHLVTLWPGTHGAHLNKDQLIRQKIVTGTQLKRGEIGCYDSHYRVWKHVVENNIPNALILEDDADIRYGRETATRINHLFSELSRLHINYDLIYIGHFNYHPPKQMFGSSIGTPTGTQGLVMYYVTLQCARKLVQNAIPMQGAVDDYVYCNPNIRQFVFVPRLGGAVEIERSDTSHIA